MLKINLLIINVINKLNFLFNKIKISDKKFKIKVLILKKKKKDEKKNKKIYKKI